MKTKIRRRSDMAEFDGKQGRWITYKGRHLFIEDGKNADDVIEEHLKRDGGASYYAFKQERAEKAKKESIAKNLQNIKDNFDKINVKSDASIPFRTGKTSVGGGVETEDKTVPMEVNGQKIIPLNRDNTVWEPSKKSKYDSDNYYPGKFAVKVGDEVKVFGTGMGQAGNDVHSHYEVGNAYKDAVNAIKKIENPIDKQEREIAKRAEQTKALNDEKKANDIAKEYQTKKNALVDKYRKELRNALKKNDGKMPRKINMPTTTEGRDAVLSAIDAEYNLSPAEDKIWDTIQVQNRNGVPYLWLPGKAPVSTLGLSQKGVAGLRKWLCVWGAENL